MPAATLTPPTADTATRTPVACPECGLRMAETHPGVWDCNPCGEAERPNPDERWTYEEYTNAGYVLWGYDEFAARIGRRPQSLRKALQRRNQHIADDAAARGVPLEEGRARPLDILEPACYRESVFNQMTVLEPKWLPTDAVEWAQQMWKLKADGVTPILPRSGLLARD